MEAVCDQNKLPQVEAHPLGGFSSIKNKKACPLPPSYVVIHAPVSVQKKVENSKEKDTERHPLKMHFPSPQPLHINTAVSQHIYLPIQHFIWVLIRLIRQ